MAKMKSATVYFCQNCGYESSKWMGQCPGCREWNTLVEEVVTKASGVRAVHMVQPTSLNDISMEEEDKLLTHMSELDRVLGGGIVPGQLTLVGGDPGIGKSTILLQMCQNLAADGRKILYISGEESLKQIKIRAIQTMYAERVTSAPGSVSQVREATAVFLRLAKSMPVATFIVGHVTKEGTVAGPRVLEHMVDTVLYFEGDRHASYRILRGVKNRFGSTDEIGVFEMRKEGLCEVKNPSAYLLSGRPKNASGSVVACAMEGTRPMLIEIQALVCDSNFNIPRRQTTGADFNRVNLLMAVLEKRLGLRMGQTDAYVNLAGGMRLLEPALDLGIVMALVSSFKNKVISDQTVIFGEVGLSGEVRAVNMAQQRVLEAQKLGFTKCILPSANLDGLSDIPEKMRIVGVSNVADAINELI